MPRAARAIRPVECAFVALVGAASLGATCVPNPNDRPLGDMGGGPLGVGYAEIQMDMNASCLTGAPTCHGPTATKAMLKIGPDLMANHKLVKSMFVSVSDPAQSLLLLKATNMSMHDGGALLKTTDAVYAKWLKWITDGAVFDPSQKPVTFVDIEKDLKDAGAKGCGTALPVCHSATATKAKLKLGADSAANYQLVKSMFVDTTNAAQSPLLLKATNGTMHDGGAVFGTSDPLYTKWLGWISDGAPEK